MSDKLSIFNGVLRLLGDTRLASLSEAREPRRILDDLWTEHVKACLEAGDWNFCIRNIQIDPDPSVILTHGYAYAFEKPEDWLRTSAISLDETFATPLIDYSDESGYWKADSTPLYVKYVSGDAAYGMDPSIWTPSFSLFVQAHLAAEMAVHHKNASFKDMDELRRRRRGDALARDAIGQPPQFQPRGSWITARWGSSTRNERTRQ
jgi:hypothetical protein